MKKTWTNLAALAKETWSRWNKDNAPRLGAALAFYSVFALAPLLIIVLSILGLVFEEQQAHAQLMDEIQQMLGRSAAEGIDGILTRSAETGAGWWAAMIGIVLLVIGASGAFIELRAALNTVFEATPSPSRSWFSLVRDRLLSFSLVLCRLTKVE